MASVKVVPKWSKKKKNGEIPLYIRIIKDRKSTFISMRYGIMPDYWDKENNCVKRSHPNSTRLNSFIINKVVEINNIVLQAETENSLINLNKLKQKITGKNTISFLSYFDKNLQTLKKQNKLSSHKKYKSIREKVATYLKGSDISFKDIDVTWLKNYELYLKTELGNSQNTVHSNLKVIRKLFNEAITEELIPKELYPFDKYKLNWEKKKENPHLKEEDVVRLRNLILDRGSIEDISRNIFVFSCYTGGIRISDLLLLKWKNYDGTKISFTSHKTRDKVHLPIPTIGKEILSIYHQGDYAQKSEEFIFPILKDVPFTTPNEKQLAFSRKTATINKTLKKVAKKAKLDQPNISTHWARRTFACMALDRGVTLDVVSKLLGHSGEQITVESYAEYSDKVISSAMAKFG